MSSDLIESRPAPRRAGACVTLIVLAVCAAYARLFASDFTWWDDQMTLHQNAFMNPPTLLTLRYYWTTMQQGLYVPVTFTIWAALAKLAFVGQPDDFGISLNPTFFHAASIACHCGASTLVFLILRRLVASDRAALLGALLFALHPLQVETIGWVSGGKDLFCWLGGLGVVLLYVRRVQEAIASGRPVWASWELPCAALLLVVAILSKPTAMVVPAALLMIDGLALRRRWLRPLLELAPLLAIAAAGMVVARIAQYLGVHEPVPLWKRPLIIGDALLFYLGKLVWPATLSADYGRNPTAAMASPWIWARWTVPAAIAVLLLIYRRRAPLLALAGAIVAIGIAPVSGVAIFQMQRISTTTDHYFYFSMLGPAIALAWAASRSRGRAFAIVAAAALAALGARTYVQTATWHDAFALFDGTIRSNPRSTMARCNLVVCYLGKLRPEPEKALPYAVEAYAIAPDDVTVVWNYGVVMTAVDRYDEAAAAFEHAWELGQKAAAPRRFKFELSRAAAEGFRDSKRFELIKKWVERELANEPDDGPAKALLIEVNAALDKQAATRPATAPATRAASPAA